MNAFTSGSKYLLTTSLISSLIFGMSSLVVHADEASDIANIKNNLQKRTPPFNVKSVKQSPIVGVYEVFANGNMYYMDKDVAYVFFGGSLYEDATKKNLTVERKKELTSIKFDSLPFKDAIEIKKGTGAYKFAVFSDPDCPFCKTLEQGLEKDIEGIKITDYTAYIFLFPLKELHPDAVAKAENIWCAKDKKEAWQNWMIKDIAPEKASCENPILRNEQLATDFGVSGTPTIYLNDGSQTQDLKELVSSIIGKKINIIKSQ